MKEMRTLGKTTWDKIKVGEVFAVNGCWQIWIKLSENIDDAKCLAEDYTYTYQHRFYYMIKNFSDCYNRFRLQVEINNDSGLYKLPKSVQKLWYGDA